MPAYYRAPSQIRTDTTLALNELTLPIGLLGQVDEGGLEPPCGVPDLQSGAVAAVPLVRKVADFLDLGLPASRFPW